MRTGNNPRVVAMSMVAASVLSLSCREMPTDPWTTELPSGSVQLIVNPVRNAEFNDRVSGLPRRNDMTSPSRFVVRTPEEWTALWTKLLAPGAPPVVDFETEMVIGEAIGVVAPPWEEVLVVGVMENAGQLYVMVLRDGSNTECIPAARQAFDGSPVALALVPKREGTPKYLVRFVPMPPCSR